MHNGCKAEMEFQLNEQDDEDLEQKELICFNEIRALVIKLYFEITE
jgi:hypothetical protein